MPEAKPTEPVPDPAVGEIPAVVLAGGLGTRLQSIAAGAPKVMMPISGKPFLEHLLHYMWRQGVRRVVLCVGHRADAIRTHFGSGSALGMDLSYVVEDVLLGTGGALRQGALAAGTPTVFGINGDSFVELDFGNILRFHRTKRARLTVALVQVDEAVRFGAVDVDASSGRITAFGEKSRQGPGLISAGAYVLERAAIDGIPSGVASLEYDVLPKEQGVYGFLTGGLFVDIGTPAAYRRLADTPKAFVTAVGSGGVS